MLNVEVDKKKKILKNFIMMNEHFAGNEDLLEEFCDSTYARLENFLFHVNDISKIETYINKIVTITILSVLKKMGRLDGKKKKTSASLFHPKKTVELTEIVKNNQNVSFQNRILYEIVDPKLSKSNNFSKSNSSDEIANFVRNISSNHDNKQCLKILKSRFLNKQTQSQIAFELELTKEEVAKRIFEIFKIAKNGVNS